MHTAGLLRAVVRRRDFRQLMNVRLTSQLADGIFQASLAGSVFFNPNRQADPLDFALGFVVLLVPYSLIGPFAGVLLDRLRRRNILMVANLVRATLVPAVAALVGFGDQGYLFLLAALVAISVNRFFLAGLSASLPHVADPDALVTANSLSTTAGTIFFAIGGGLAVAFSAVVGTQNYDYALTALISVPGYLLSAVAARGFTPGQLGPEPGDHRPPAREVLRGGLEVIRGMAAGARHLSKRRGAGYALAAVSASKLLYGISTIATLLLYRNHFVGGPVFKAGLIGLGQVVGAGALGALAAAAVTPYATRHLAPWIWVTSMLLSCSVIQLALGLPYLPATFVPAAFCIGLASQGIKIVTDTAVQTECDDAYQGRVFSFYDTLVNVFLVVGLLLGAVTLPDSGKSYAVLAVIAGGYAVAGGAYAALASRWHRDQGFLATGHALSQPSGVVLD
jgi:MFS family permease